MLSKLCLGSWVEPWGRTGEGLGEDLLWGTPGLLWGVPAAFLG